MSTLTSATFWRAWCWRTWTAPCLLSCWAAACGWDPSSPPTCRMVPCPPSWRPLSGASSRTSLTLLGKMSTKNIHQFHKNFFYHVFNTSAFQTAPAASVGKLKENNGIRRTFESDESLNGEFMSKILHLLHQFYPIFTYVDPDPQSSWIRIH